MARNHRQTTPTRRKAAVRVTLNAKVIGRRIRATRKAGGFSIAALAARVDCKYQTLACYECGASIPRRDALCKLSIALRRTLDFLVFGKHARGRA